jgi:hypothetical protein
MQSDAQLEPLEDAHHRAVSAEKQQAFRRLGGTFDGSWKQNRRDPNVGQGYILLASVSSWKASAYFEH